MKTQNARAKSFGKNKNAIVACSSASRMMGMTGDERQKWWDFFDRHLDVRKSLLRLKERMESYKIIVKQDGTFLCEVQIQDGTERWKETSLDEAKKWVKKSMKILNGTDIKKKSIPIYREEPIQTIRLIKVN